MRTRSWTPTVGALNDHTETVPRVPGHDDPEASEITFTVTAPSAADESEHHESIALCRNCGAPVSIFREVAWYLPDEAAEEF